jgi:hypothetical protein
VNRFSEYTTDELYGLLRFSSAASSLFANVSAELAFRRQIRNAWLDHCNAVAGEVIA